MIDLIRILFSFFLISALISCGDDYRADIDTGKKLTQTLYVIPDASTEIRGEDTLIASEDETLRFIALLSIGGATLGEEDEDSYVMSVTWTIDGEDYLSTSLVRTFSEAGAHKVFLRTIDFLQDTLQDSLTLLISAPVSITATTPPDGYNQLSAFDTAGTKLSWNIEGLDSWETPVCILYLSHNRDSLWITGPDTIPCTEAYTLRGPFTGQDSSVFSDSSIVFYWGVKVRTGTALNKNERDSTGIQTFRTRLAGTDKARIDVPVALYLDKNPENPETHVLLLSAAGDTVAEQLATETPYTFSFTGVPPQTGLRIIVSEARLAEYGPETTTVSIARATYNTEDRIYLHDNTAPQRFPAATAFANGDSIRFYYLDDGSGINPSKTLLTENGDTLDYSAQGAEVTFRNICSAECMFRFDVTDYAGNSAAAVHWKIKADGDSICVTGPFDDGGDK